MKDFHRERESSDVAGEGEEGGGESSRVDRKLAVVGWGQESGERISLEGGKRDRENRPVVGWEDHLRAGYIWQIIGGGK